jgi:hypothetical protein
MSRQSVLYILRYVKNKKALLAQLQIFPVRMTLLYHDLAW